MTVPNSGKHAYFSVNRSKDGFSVTVKELISCINFIIDNSYITYKGKIYRQIIGIPMGTNCAPYLANLFLHEYEISYIEGLLSNNMIEEAKLLSHIFRYQDDCIVFNDYNTFGNAIKDIYPTEMVLKETNVSATECNYLDITVKCLDGRVFMYNSYDKRLDYNFEVINYPDLAGNVPTSQSYGVFTSQLIRFCEINSTLERFYSDVNVLVTKLKKLGFEGKRLWDKYTKFCNNEMNRWSKFGMDISSIGEYLVF